MSAVTNNPYTEEAAARWGETDAYKESQRRTSNYSKEDIAAAQSDMHAATLLMADAMQRGLATDSDEARAAAEAHRLSISRWWYECSPEMHKNLGLMYVADPRFAKFYEDIAPGLAQYMCDAIQAA